MKTRLAIPAAVAAIALVGAIAFGGIQQAAATDVGLIAPIGTMLDEGQGFAYTLGSKQAVGHFAKSDKGCALTLVVGERGDGTVTSPSVGARLRVVVAHGGDALLESGEGPAMQVRCTADASQMRIIPIGGGTI